MSDRDVMFNGEWHARVRVQHAAFLNVAVMTDVDAGVVAPNADIGPDAGLRPDQNITDQIS